MTGKKPDRLSHTKTVYKTRCHSLLLKTPGTIFLTLHFRSFYRRELAKQKTQ